MNDHVYSVTEVVGSSRESIEDAINNAVETASKTLRNLEWLEVNGTRGHIVDGKVEHYQVYVRLGFRYDPK